MFQCLFLMIYSGNKKGGINMNFHESNQFPNYQVVVLCSGIGGSVLGYRNANMNVKVAIDYNEFSAHIIGKNFQDTNVFLQSIENTNGNDLRFICQEELDVLDITIPSRYINYKIKESLAKQSQFLMEIMRIIYEAQPKIVVFHFDNRFNQGKHRLLVNDWMELVKEIGYDIHLETLKSSLYGIPNEKKWGFIIGVRKDIGIKPSFPEAVDVKISTKRAIGDLMDEEPDLEVNPNRLKFVQEYFYPLISYKEVKRIVKELDLPIYPAYYRRDRWEEPFYPLSASNVRPLHPIKDRLLTLTEAKRLQTFPDDYILTDNPSFNWKEICSSIPPNLIQCVGESLKKDILRFL